MASRKEQREKARRERLAAERAAEAARNRRFRIAGAVAALLAALIVAGIVVAVVSSGGGSASLSGKVKTKPLSSVGRLVPAGSAGAKGAEGVPVPKGPALAPAGSPAPGKIVDGISCQGGEQTLFHVHTHLTVFVDGKPRQIPFGIGIAPPRQVQQTSAGPFVASGACFAWLHTHAPDGIVHIESPVRRQYTLGDFFDVWGQPLSPDQVGPAHGHVTGFYNGQVYVGNPRNIPIGDHTQIQLDVGKPLVAPEHVSFPNGL
jgi:hypothetical protein